MASSIQVRPEVLFSTFIIILRSNRFFPPPCLCYTPLSLMRIPTAFLLYPVLLAASNSQAFAFHLAGGPPASSKIPMASSDQPPTSVDDNALSTKGATFPVPTEDLSIDRVRKTIHACCSLTNDRAASTGYFFRNGNQDDMPVIKLLLGSDEDVEADSVSRLMRDSDLFHSVIIEEKTSGKIVGFAICYWAYSTWEGRYLYVNKIIVSPNGDDVLLPTILETSLVYTLADAAVRLGGQRLVWQVRMLTCHSPHIVFLASRTLDIH